MFAAEYSGPRSTRGDYADWCWQDSGNENGKHELTCHLSVHVHLHTYSHFDVVHFLMVVERVLVLGEGGRGRCSFLS